MDTSAHYLRLDVDDLRQVALPVPTASGGDLRDTARMTMDFALPTAEATFEKMPERPDADLDGNAREIHGAPRRAWRLGTFR